MLAWLQLAIYAGLPNDDPGVTQIGGELLRTDKPAFDSYAALLVALRSPAP